MQSVLVHSTEATHSFLSGQNHILHLRLVSCWGKWKKNTDKRLVLGGSLLCAYSDSFIKNNMSYSLSSWFSAVEKIVSTSQKQLLINIESWWLALELLPKSGIGEYGAGSRNSNPLATRQHSTTDKKSPMWGKENNNKREHFTPSPAFSIPAAKIKAGIQLLV